MHGHHRERRCFRQEVVHAFGRVAFGLRVTRLDSERVGRAPDRVSQLDNQTGIDRTLENRVAVGLDTGDMFRNRGLSERHA